MITRPSCVTPVDNDPKLREEDAGSHAEATPSQGSQCSSAWVMGMATRSARVRIMGGLRWIIGDVEKTMLGVWPLEWVIDKQYLVVHVDEEGCYLLS
ncbi:hypothetical protein NDU88_005354 [Pleurodeles waltl]|uniref:Uncharacterized protein n=1 Tax=Pleurodeles waltl TaxID=8319 RepID=A0AAV7L0H8_PLEWA|nr:hypothetical protein NDU88_005354 [Pleurodeles waltl]